MRFVIVTGVSGAGKTTALKMLEDRGYFCVDNLPVPMLEEFMSLVAKPDREKGQDQNVAIGIDVRNGQSLDKLEQVLEDMKMEGYRYEILFLEASDPVLIRRYKETRRNHPLAAGERLDLGILRERGKMAFLKARADYILDTSQLLTRELAREIDRIFVDNGKFNSLMISVLSFGFKYGIPVDADLVFDVRFLPNPYYVEELSKLSGEDEPVRDYVMSSPAAREFLAKLEELVKFLLPYYEKEGKNNLVIGIGCTGGRHRSVAVANELYGRLDGYGAYGIRLEHRDIPRDSIRKT